MTGLPRWLRGKESPCQCRKTHERMWWWAACNWCSWCPAQTPPTLSRSHPRWRPLSLSTCNFAWRLFLKAGNLAKCRAGRKCQSQPPMGQLSANGWWELAGKPPAPSLLGWNTLNPSVGAEPGCFASSLARPAGSSLFLLLSRRFGLSSPETSLSFLVWGSASRIGQA